MDDFPNAMKRSLSLYGKKLEKATLERLTSIYADCQTLRGLSEGADISISDPNPNEQYTAVDLWSRFEIKVTSDEGKKLLSSIILRADEVEISTGQDVAYISFKVENAWEV